LVAARVGGFFDRQELFGPESLIMDLCCCFDKILKVSAGQKVAKIDEFTMLFVFN
jgi:hypothetical protein